MMYLRFYLITIFVVLSFFLQAQEVIQKEGLAKLWESSEYAHQYAALHQDAPVGTLIEVKNLKNDRIVIVEVVGKPEDSNKSNTLIYISQKAYTRLESANPLFTVNIKYKPETPQNSFVVDPILWKQESQAQKNPFENPFQPNLMPNQNISTPNQFVFHVVNPSQRNIYDIARLYHIYDAHKIAEWNNLSNNYVLTPGQRLVIYFNMNPSVLVNTNYQLAQVDQVNERGFAEVTQDIDDPKPFVALHASAPVGTLITLRNPSNGKSVVVTVLGSMKNAQTGTIIQITEASYIRLGATQSKFPVSINYLANSSLVQNNSNPNNSPNGSVKYDTPLSTRVAYLPSDILTDKWWVAFHKNAPVGSYIQVKNPQNNQSVTFLVAGPLQGNTTDNQVMMQIGQAGMHALNQGGVVDQLAVTMELVKGVSEGDMERIIRDIANVFEEGVGVSYKSQNTKKYTCLHKTAPIGTLILVEKPTLQAVNRYFNRTYYNTNDPFANLYNNSNYNTNPFNQPDNQLIYNIPNPYQASNYNTNPFNQPDNQIIYNNPNPYQASNYNTNPFNQPNTTLVNPQNLLLRNRLIVEVVGKLPDTEENEDILIKLSEDAFQALTNEKISLALKISYFEW
ncbi:MAG: LysM peptidoglycan-binding domain-containing protein [Microscillaceae bacterium]|nr:LysM peptidoglycan-binding domain-containing protein [Microscillaceae bacterium]